MKIIDRLCDIIRGRVQRSFDTMRQFPLPDDVQPILRRDKAPEHTSPAIPFLIVAIISIAVVVPLFAAFCLIIIYEATK